MGNLQTVNQRFIGGARPVVDEISLTDADGHLAGKKTVTTEATAAAVTYTPAQVVGGLIIRDPNGAARSDVMPTAADLVAYFANQRREECVKAGLSFEFTIRNNDGGAAETITMTAGTGGTLSGTMTIATANSKRFLVVFTNVDAGSEAYTMYSLGTVVH